MIAMMTNVPFKSRSRPPNVVMSGGTARLRPKWTPSEPIHKRPKAMCRPLDHMTAPHFETFRPYRASSSRTTLRKVFRFSSLPSTYSRRRPKAMCRPLDHMTAPHFETFRPYRASSSRTTLRKVDFRFSSLPSTYFDPSTYSRRAVDEGLIVPAARVMDLVAKPLENVVVNPDCDSSLAWRGLDDRATFASAEIVFFLHLAPSYRRRSERVASRAEINLTISFLQL